MKKIKVIDLLNKIANEEEVPKKIAYTPLDGNRYILEYDEKAEDYYDGNDYLGDSCYKITHCLNDEVEIIEESKEIERISQNLSMYNEVESIFRDKINELIEVVNELKKEGE